MNQVLYIKQSVVQEISLESRPYEDMGFDYENYDNFEELGENHDGEAGLVSIDVLINSLQELKSNGANYVSCDWHCDHVELDLYGVQYRLATPEEIEAFKQSQKLKKEDEKKREIERLEQKLKRLKDEQ
jgi:hypothetical protein